MESHLEKIRKLIAHQKSAQEMGSLKEAEAFAKKVQNLLDKYNISLEDIPLEKVKNDMTELRMKTAIPSVSDVLGYSVMVSIAKWNWCKAYKVGSKYSIVVGLKLNTEVCQMVYETVLPIFIKEGKLAYLEAPRKVGLDTFQREFIEGCASGLWMKLKEEREEFEKRYLNCSALIVRNDKAIELFVQEQYGGTKKGRSKTIKKGEAYDKGFITGKNVEIQKRIDA